MLVAPLIPSTPGSHMTSAPMIVSTANAISIAGVLGKRGGGGGGVGVGVVDGGGPEVFGGFLDGGSSSLSGGDGHSPCYTFDPFLETPVDDGDDDADDDEAGNGFNHSNSSSSRNDAAGTGNFLLGTGAVYFATLAHPPQ